MEFNKVDLKLIESYSILVRAGEESLSTIPEKYKDAVELKIAKETIKLLSEEEI